MRPEHPLCPSARPEMEGSVVLGVIRELGGEEIVHHLAEPLPVTPEILALAAPARPTEVFRFAAPCAEHACGHFDGTDCRLAAKMVAVVSHTLPELPPCRIRATCRWFVQEGKAACHRCPLIFSETANPSPELAYAADPSQ
ncbi:MAG TPA: nitrogen fixation protein [Thermoanaerobaculia bacterium]|nr:nitrogen fixation protein [Thermoanaerobaculia bacterium]